MRTSMTSKKSDIHETFLTKPSSYRLETYIGFKGDSGDFPFKNDLKNWEHYIITYFKHMRVVF